MLLSTTHELGPCCKSLCVGCSVLQNSFCTVYAYSGNLRHRFAVRATFTAGSTPAVKYVHIGANCGKALLCIQQVYSSVKGARLLMCAPQNYSADLLFKALAAAGITNDYMIRLNDPRVPPAQVSPQC